MTIFSAIVKALEPIKNFKAKQAIEPFGGAVTLTFIVELGREGVSYFNAIALGFGFVMWAGGLIAERRDERNNPEPTHQEAEEIRGLNTKTIQRLLNYTGGYGVTAGLVRLIKNNDSNVAKAGLLTAGIIQLISKSELKKACNPFYDAPHRPWALFRFLLRSLADGGLQYILKKAIDNKELDGNDYIIMLLASGSDFSEGAYGVTHDEKLPLKNMLVRRMMQFLIVAAVGEVTEDVIDIVLGQISDLKNIIVDDIYLLLSAVLELINFVVMHLIERNKKTILSDYMAEMLSDDEFEQRPPQDEQKHTTITINNNDFLERFINPRKATVSQSTIFLDESELVTYITPNDPKSINSSNSNVAKPDTPRPAHK